MASETQRKPIELPWTTIIAVLAATGGLFLFLNPLETSRPRERNGLELHIDRVQDVDARLWQDPLRAAAEHDTRVQALKKDAQEQFAEENSRHSTEFFSKQIS